MDPESKIRKALAIAGIFLLAFFASQRIFQVFPYPAGWKTIITSDGRGYYAYLPAIFLEGDLTFRKTSLTEKKLYGLRDYNPVYLVRYGDKEINKYFAGEAILLLPFFLLAMLLTRITGLPMDGYSFFFQLLTGLGALFWLFAGLIFLKKILKRLSIESGVTILVLAGILFATNLFYYTLWQPSMSHVYSFFAVNAFLWFSLRSTEEARIRELLFAGLFYGLVILLRPVNGLVLLVVPLLCTTNEQLRAFFRSLFPWKILVPAAAASLVMSIQPAIWHAETGRFFLWSYTGEGFNLASPEIYKVLFSFRKGLFVYTPFLLLAIPGIFTFVRKPWYRFISLVLFLVAIGWVISSWWNWYYGDGFGMRPFIDFYGIFAILIAAFFRLFRSGKILAFFAVVIGILAFINLFQTWQYNNRVIHPSLMNRAKYWYVFMRADSSLVDCFGGSDELASRGTDLSKPICIIANSFEKELAGWKNDTRLSRPGLAYNGKFVGVLDSLNEFSPGLDAVSGKIFKVPSKPYCRVSIMIFDSTIGASNEGYFVASIDSFDHRHNFWYGFRLNDIPRYIQGKWQRETYGFNLPEITNPAAKIKMYVWDPRRKTFYIDDLQIEFYGGGARY